MIAYLPTYIFILRIAGGCPSMSFEPLPQISSSFSVRLYKKHIDSQTCKSCCLCCHTCKVELLLSWIVFLCTTQPCLSHLCLLSWPSGFSCYFWLLVLWQCSILWLPFGLCFGFVCLLKFYGDELDCFTLPYLLISFLQIDPYSASVSPLLQIVWRMINGSFHLAKTVARTCSVDTAVQTVGLSFTCPYWWWTLLNWKWQVQCY